MPGQLLTHVVRIVLRVVVSARDWVLPSTIAVECNWGRITLRKIELGKKALTLASKSMLPYGIASATLESLTLRVVLVPVPSIEISMSNLSVECGLKSTPQIRLSIVGVKVAATARLAVDAFVERISLTTIAMSKRCYEFSLSGIAAEVSRKSAALRLRDVLLVEATSKATIIGKVSVSKGDILPDAIDVGVSLSDNAGEIEISHLAFVCHPDALIGFARLAASIIPPPHTASKATPVKAEHSDTRPSILLSPMPCAMKLSIAAVHLIIPDIRSSRKRFPSLAGSCAISVSFGNDETSESALLQVAGVELRRCTLVDKAFDGTVTLQDKASHSLIEILGEGVDLEVKYACNLLPKESEARRSLTAFASEILFAVSPPDIALLARFSNGCSLSLKKCAIIMKEHEFKEQRIVAEQIALDKNQRRKDALEAFTRIDQDGSGSLDREEVLHLFRDSLGFRKLLLPQELDMLLSDFFYLVDQDGDGSVSLEEFEHAFEVFATSNGNKSLHTGYISKLASEYVLPEHSFSDEAADEILAKSEINFESNNDSDKMKKLVRAVGSYTHAMKLWSVRVEDVPFSLEPADSCGGLSEINLGTFDAAENSILTEKKSSVQVLVHSNIAVSIEGIGFQVSDTAISETPALDISFHDLSISAACALHQGKNLLNESNSIDATLKVAANATYFAASRGDAGLTEPLFDPWDGILIRIAKPVGEHAIKAHCSSTSPLRFNVTEELLRILSSTQKTVAAATDTSCSSTGIDHHIDEVGGVVWIRNRLGIPFKVKVLGTSPRTGLKKTIFGSQRVDDAAAIIFNENTNAFDAEVEFLSCLDQRCLREKFRDADDDASGMLSADEVRAMLQAPLLKSGSPKSAIDEFVSKFIEISDTDGSGEISFSEFSRAYEISTRKFDVSIVIEIEHFGTTSEISLNLLKAETCCIANLKGATSRSNTVNFWTDKKDTPKVAVEFFSDPSVGSIIDIRSCISISNKTLNTTEVALTSNSHKIYGEYCLKQNESVSLPLHRVGKTYLATRQVGEKEYSFDSKLFVSTQMQHPTSYVPAAFIPSPAKRSASHSVHMSRVDGQPIRVTTIERAYISDDTSMVFHKDTTFSIFPQLELVSMLPFDLEYEIVQREDSEAENIDFSLATSVNSRKGILVSGHRAQPAGLNMDSSAFLRMRFVGATTWTSGIRIRVEYSRARFINQGIQPVNFFDGVHASVEHAWDEALPMPRLIIFSPVVIQNSTGLNLQFSGKFQGRVASTESVSMYTSEGAPSALPLLACDLPVSLRVRPTGYAVEKNQQRIGIPFAALLWSRPMKIFEVGEHEVDSRSQYSIVYTVSQRGRSLLVKMKPKFVITNRLKFPLEITACSNDRNAKTKRDVDGTLVDIQTLAPGKSAVLHMLGKVAHNHPALRFRMLPEIVASEHRSLSNSTMRLSKKSSQRMCVSVVRATIRVLNRSLARKGDKLLSAFRASDEDKVLMKCCAKVSRIATSLKKETLATCYNPCVPSCEDAAHEDTYDVLWMEEMSYVPTGDSGSNDEKLQVDLSIRKLGPISIARASVSIDEISMASESESAVQTIEFESETMSGSIAIMVNFFDDSDLASWSPAFCLSNANEDDLFSLLPASTSFLQSPLKMAKLPLVRLNVTAAEGPLFVELGDGSDAPPFQLENRSDKIVYFYPKGRIHEVKVLYPSQWVSFCWDNIEKDHFIYAGIVAQRAPSKRPSIGTDRGLMTLLKQNLSALLGESPGFVSCPIKIATDSICRLRQLCFSVSFELYALEATRIISFSSSGLAISNMRGTVARGAGSLDMDSIDLHIFFSGLSIGVTDISLRDVCEVTVLGITIFSPASAASGFSLEVLHVEIDDLRPNSANPVVFEPENAGLNSESDDKITPFFSLHIVQVGDSTSMFETFAIYPQTSTANIDIDFLLDLADVFSRGMSIASDEGVAPDVISAGDAESEVGIPSPSFSSNLYFGTFFVGSFSLEANISAPPEQGGLSILVGPTLGGALGSVAQLSPKFAFEKVDFYDIFKSAQDLQWMLVKRYLMQALKQFFKLLLSFKIAGDPAGYYNKIIKSWSKGGLGSAGTAAAGGFFGILGKITGGVREVVAQSIDGQDGASSSSANAMPENVAHGTLLAGAGFGKALYSRMMKDLWMKPARGLMKDGAKGLAKGTIGGVVGALASPFLATAKFTETMMNSIEAQSHAFKKKTIKMSLRSRRSYASEQDMLLKPFADCTTLSSFEVRFPKVRRLEIDKIKLKLFRPDGSIVRRVQTGIDDTAVHFDLVEIKSRDETFKYIGVHLCGAFLEVQLVSKGTAVSKCILGMNDLYATLVPAEGIFDVALARSRMLGCNIATEALQGAAAVRGSPQKRTGRWFNTDAGASILVEGVFWKYRPVKVSI